MRSGPLPNSLEAVAIASLRGEQQAITLTFAMRDVPVAVIHDPSIRHDEAIGIGTPFPLEPEARDIVDDRLCLRYGVRGHRLHGRRARRAT